MPSPPAHERSPTMLERHVQTTIQVILLALLAWAGVELVNLGKSTAVLQERLVYQGQLINEMRRELREWSDLYYRKTDAEREFRTLRTNVSALDQRLQQLEEARP
ncbi:hypothetical protein [Vreelandella alkaliphila]|uniref:Cell division protein FtsL n=2 Tax=Vreelandella alkaliphila TaxID=272774 RepID=A0ABX4HLB4_9GAMM|nr:hypothetical protein [Halomonas humidisoli]PAU73271.1 hypothetical protein CK497_01315 [Halomonas humidisoli]